MIEWLLAIHKYALHIYIYLNVYTHIGIYMPEI